jgi:hypothetical protein
MGRRRIATTPFFDLFNRAKASTSKSNNCPSPRKVGTANLEIDRKRLAKSSLSHARIAPHQSPAQQKSVGREEFHYACRSFTAKEVLVISGRLRSEGGAAGEQRLLVHCQGCLQVMEVVPYRMRQFGAVIDGEIGALASEGGHQVGGIT